MEVVSDEGCDQLVMSAEVKSGTLIGVMYLLFLNSREE